MTAFASGSLLSARFDASALRPAERFKAYAARMEGLVEPHPTRGTEDHAEWAYSYWQVGDLLFSDHRLGPMKSFRRRDHKLRGHVLVRCLRRGEMHTIHGGRPTRIEAGEGHLFDLNVPFHSMIAAPVHGLSVAIPYEAIGYDPSRHGSHITFRAEDPVGWMLSRSMEAMTEQLDRIERQDAPRFAEAFTDLIRGLAMGGSRHDSVNARLGDEVRRAVFAYIEQRLHDENLDAARIARKFNASRATVYRWFEDHGGVRTYISGRRLERARRELEAGGPSRGRVARVGERWGYPDPAHFSRRFRAEFGVSPSDVMHAAEPLAKED